MQTLVNTQLEGMHKALEAVLPKVVTPISSVPPSGFDDDDDKKGENERTTEGFEHAEDAQNQGEPRHNESENLVQDIVEVVETDQPIPEEQSQAESVSEIADEGIDRLMVLALQAVESIRSIPEDKPETNSSTDSDKVAIGTYFSIRRESGETQAVEPSVLQETQTQNEPAQADQSQADQPAPQSLLEAERELVEKNREERLRKKQEKAARRARRKQDEDERAKLLAIQEQLNKEEEEAKKREEERLSLEAIKNLTYSSEEGSPSKGTKRSAPEKALSKRSVQAERKKLEGFVKRRLFPEKIVGVKLRKLARRKYPTIYLTRRGDSGASEEIEMVDLFKLGYEECVEIYNILLKNKPTNYSVVADDISKKIERIRILNVNTSGLPQIGGQGNDEEEDVVEGTSSRRKKQKFTLQSLDTLINTTEVLNTIKKTGYDEVMDELNFELPQGISNPQLGECIEQPEYGLIVQTHRGVIGLQRASELYKVPNIHLYALRLACIQSKEKSKNFLNLLIQEGIRRKLDLNQPAPSHVREEYFHKPS